MNGKLFIVGTPIGNMKDITLRALDTLKEVDVIATEDTRHTRILLSNYAIEKPLVSYYKQKEREGTEKIIGLLYEGKNVALVTDAGMPSISDPGAILVEAVHNEGLDVCVIPGATAVTSAIALAGLPKAKGFVFCGFLPEKTGDKNAILDNLAAVKLPLVFYVAPHDLDRIIAYLYSKLGDRKVWACKELTKIYETVYFGTLRNIKIENVKGEFVLIVDEAEDVSYEDVDVSSLLKEKIAAGLSKSDAVKAVAKETGLSKNAVYAECNNLEDN